MLTSLHGHTPPAACEFGEVLPPVAMQGNATSEAPPCPTHVRVGLGHDPLLEGLLADREQGRTAALALLAHEMHPPLVGDAGVIGAHPAELVPVEVGKPVVVILNALDHIPPAGPATAPGALGRLCADHQGGVDMLTGKLAPAVIRASAARVAHLD
jgi:hypothetical protein